MDRLFDNEWVLRGLALVLALFLWVQATLTFITLGSATVRNVPLDVVGVPPGVVVTSRVKDVEVTVVAPSTLARLLPSEFLATVTPGVSLGTQRADVTVAVPRGTRLKTVSPDIVTLTVSRVASHLKRAASRRN